MIFLRNFSLPSYVRSMHPHSAFAAATVGDCSGALVHRLRGRQGCSTLWNAEEVEEAIEAADGSAKAVLGE